eukprot:120296-Chlamydomonas_euryale.AAC.2
MVRLKGSLCARAVSLEWLTGDFLRKFPEVVALKMTTQQVRGTVAGRVVLFLFLRGEVRGKAAKRRQGRAGLKEEAENPTGAGSQPAAGSHAISSWQQLAAGRWATAVSSCQTAAEAVIHLPCLQAPRPASLSRVSRGRR